MCSQRRQAIHTGRAGRASGRAHSCTGGTTSCLTARQTKFAARCATACTHLQHSLLITHTRGARKPRLSAFCAQLYSHDGVLCADHPPSLHPNVASCTAGAAQVVPRLAMPGMRPPTQLTASTAHREAPQASEPETGASEGPHFGLSSGLAELQRGPSSPGVSCIT